MASNIRVKTWQTDALWQLKTVQCPDWGYPLQIEMVFYWEDRRRRDLDNACSSVLDILRKAEIIAEDDYLHVDPLILKFGGIDKTSPRVEIKIDERIIT